MLPFDPFLINHSSASLLDPSSRNPTYDDLSVGTYTDYSNSAVLGATLYKADLIGGNLSAVTDGVNVKSVFIFKETQDEEVYWQKLNLSGKKNAKTSQSMDTRLNK